MEAGLLVRLFKPGMATGTPPAPASADHYVWWFPGAPLRVHLALPVVRRLCDQLDAAGKGAAIEGVLRGGALDNITAVSDCAPAQGDIRLAAADARVVGYYRVAGSLALSDTDVALAAECFPHPHQVILLIQPAAFGAPAASFFFHNAGGAMSPLSLMEFPLDAALLAGEERERMRRSQQQSVPAPALVIPAMRARRRRVLPAIAAGLFLLLLGGGAWRTVQSGAAEQWLRRSPVHSADRKSPEPVAAETPPRLQSMWTLGLRARRRSNDLEITWNPDSPAVAAATAGKLVIQDGAVRHNLALGPAEVRTSRVLYFPRHEQIDLKLTITAGPTSITEDALVLAPRDGPAQVFVTPPQQPNPAPKPFTAPARPAPANPAPRITEDPPPLAAPPVSGVAPPAWMASLAPAGAPAPPPAAAKAAVAARAAVFYPAQPVRKITPRIPPALQQLLPRPATIEVQVSVDEKGRVVRAEAVPQPPINIHILQLAVDATRFWTFTPARRGDTPLPSQVTVRFKFE